MTQPQRTIVAEASTTWHLGSDPDDRKYYIGAKLEELVRVNRELVHAREDIRREYSL